MKRVIVVIVFVVAAFAAYRHFSPDGVETKYKEFAEEMLRRIRPKDMADAQVASSDFSAFLQNRGSTAASMSPEQRDALFREFLQWRERQTQNNQSQGTRRQ